LGEIRDRHAQASRGLVIEPGIRQGIRVSFK
jgi:hypothetical protein